MARGNPMNENETDASRQPGPEAKTSRLDYLAARLERLTRQAGQLADTLRQKPVKP